MLKRSTRLSTLLTALLLICWWSLLIDSKLSITTNVTASTYKSDENLKVFDQVWNIINKQYYDTKFNGLDWAKMREIYRPKAAMATNEPDLYQLMNEMIKQLKDNHVVVVAPAVVKRLKTRAYPNIGFSVRIVEEKLVVTLVRPGSEAAEVGVAPGWLLTHVDNEPINFANGLSFDVGQKINLRFVDAKDQNQEIQLNCCRNLALVPPQQAKMLDNNILYLKFESFDERTDEWLKSQLKNHREAKGVIIDIRKNYGGLISVLEKCLKLFFVKGRLVGEYIERDGKKTKIKIDDGGKNAFNGPVSVLTDQLSISCAEIFAAGIKEAKRGITIGRTTRGDVLPSIKEKLSDGGELQYSIANFFTSNGTRLEGNGSEPDIKIELKLSDLRQNIDRDLETAITQLKLQLK